MKNIDVIIPAYNASAFIAETIKSALAQSYKPSSIIVVNDGSTDNTVEIVQTIAETSLIPIRIISQPNRGLSASRNIGIKAATADFVALLDADDIWLPTKLAEQISVFNKGNEKLGVVYCGFNLIDSDGQSLPRSGFVFDEKIRGNVSKILRRGNFVAGSGSAVLIKRNLFKKVGFFDETLPAAEDWDMWIRLAQKCDFDYTRKELLRIRRHSKSMQQDSMLMLRAEILFLDKRMRDGTLYRPLLKHIRHRLRTNSISAKNIDGYETCLLSLRIHLSPLFVHIQKSISFIYYFRGLAEIVWSHIRSGRWGELIGKIKRKISTSAVPK